jgi:GT2 family glycosyltransferase
VLVPKLWLQQLVALANSNKTFGMVGPMSNMAPEPQRVPEVPYRLRRRRDPASAGPPQPGLDTTPFDQFAQEYRERNKGQWAEVERLGGFCLLLRRAALSTGALLEGQGEDGVFDADRLCLRVRRAGHRLACCRDLYVHHFGSHWAAAER